MRLTATFTGFDAALDDLEAALARALPAGVAAAAQHVADDARANHPFQNRTGDLEASIHAEEDPHATLVEAIDAFVVADEAYASYVEGRPEFAFLEPAAARQEAAMADALDHALDQAAHDAGWTR